MDSSKPQPTGPPLVHHISINPAGKTTILFIHGVFGTHADWNLVTPHLEQTYHLLLPDLPGHGLNPSTIPFSIAGSASSLAVLIREKAHNGKAHIVGGSLGAQIAIHLATQYPDLVLSCLVSGFGNRSPADWARPYLPYALWAYVRVENAVPRPVLRWLMDGTDLPRHANGGPSLELCRDMVGPTRTSVTSATEPQHSSGQKRQEVEGPASEESKLPTTGWPSRTLVIAAGKSGLLPTADQADVAAQLAAIGREGSTGNQETYAVLHRDKRHPWMRQDGQLFAATVRAWIEGEKIPDGFERL